MYGPPAGPPPKKKRRGVLVAAITAVAVIIAGGGVWALMSLRGAGGAASPEEALEKLVDDAAALDWAKTASHVAPSERTLFTSWAEVAKDALGEPKTDEDVTDALKSLVATLTVDVTDVTVSSKELVTDVQRTELTDGSLTIDGDPAKVAAAVMDLIDTAGGASSFTDLMSGGYDTDVSESEIRDQLDEALPMETTVKEMRESAGVDSLFVVTVKEDGKWFTSLSMTIAQYAYEAAGMDSADLGDPVPADQMMGADKPEDAIGRLVDAVDKAASSGDLRDLAKALPVAESRLLAVYGSALADQEAVKSALGAFKVTDAKTSVFKDHGTMATVTVDSLAVEAGSVHAEFTRDGSEWTLEAGEDGGDDGISAVLGQPDRQTLDLEATIDELGDQHTLGAHVTIPDKGQLRAELDADGQESGFEYDGECLRYWDTYSEDESCDRQIPEALAEAGLDQFGQLPDLKGLIALTAVKGSGGKWYISGLGSPLAGGALVGAVAAMASSGFGVVDDYYLEDGDYEYDDEYSDDWDEDWDEDEYFEDWDEEYSDSWDEEYFDDWDETEDGTNNS
jgi:hypothetical protein